MRGVSTVIVTSTLLVIAAALVALVMPWVWSTLTGVLDAIGRYGQVREKLLLSDVRIMPPPAINPYGKPQRVFIHNSGEIPLRNALVKMMDTNFYITDLNLYVLRRNGTWEGPEKTVPIFYPGDVIIAVVPPEKNYIGYQFIFQSRDYSEGIRVGE